MASSSAVPPHADRITELKKQLYKRCTEEDINEVFRQEDLMAMRVIPQNDAVLLMQVVQRLVDEKLFKMVRDGLLGWMYRSVEDAAK